MNACLLVVDVQTGMFDGIKIPKVWNDATLLKNIASLVSAARERHLPVMFVQHDGGNGHVLAKDSAGFSIHQAIAPLANESVIVKNKSNSFAGTDLQKRLEELEIQRIFICGIQTDECVDSTCRGAHSLGFDVKLVSDAHSTWPNGQLTAEQIIQQHNAIWIHDKLADLRTTIEAKTDFKQFRGLLRDR